MKGDYTNNNKDQGNVEKSWGNYSENGNQEVDLKQQSRRYGVCDMQNGLTNWEKCRWKMTRQ